jgi:hypothetical protein
MCRFSIVNVQPSSDDPSLFAWKRIGQLVFDDAFENEKRLGTTK